MEINREHFEAYIFNQPPDRPLKLSQGEPGDCPGCLVNNFMRENHSGRYKCGWSSVVVDNGTAWGGEAFSMPEWLVALIRDLVGNLNYDCTFGKVQRRYIELFGDPNPIEPALNSERVEGRV